MDQQLSENIKQQTNKLLQQLDELEELKDELEPEEYDELKQETLSQLEEFQNGLNKMENKDLSLNDEINKAKIELQNALKKAYNKDEIKQTLMQSESVGIRENIKKIERDHNLGKVTKDNYQKYKLQYINQLVDLKQELTKEEQEFQDQFTQKNAFQQASNNQDDHDGIINQANKQVNKLN